jgi:hypothetical protein
VARGRLDLQQPSERRSVLLLEQDDVKDEEPLAGAEMNLVAGMDQLRVGRLARV